MKFYKVIMKKRVESEVRAKDEKEAIDIALSGIIWPHPLGVGEEEVFWDEIEIHLEGERIEKEVKN